MKKTFYLSLMLSMFAATVPCHAEDGTIIDGRTLIPARGVFEELGFTVDWDASNETAVIRNSQYIVSVKKGGTTINVNGEELVPDVPQQIIDGRFYIPLRFIGEAVGADIDWEQKTRTAIIQFNGKTSIVNCGGTAAESQQNTSESAPTAIKYYLNYDIADFGEYIKDAPGYNPIHSIIDDEETYYYKFDASNADYIQEKFTEYVDNMFKWLSGYYYIQCTPDIISDIDEWGGAWSVDGSGYFEMDGTTKDKLRFDLKFCYTDYQTKEGYVEVKIYYYRQFTTKWRDYFGVPY